MYSFLVPLTLCLLLGLPVHAQIDGNHPPIAPLAGTYSCAPTPPSPPSSRLRPPPPLANFTSVLTQLHRSAQLGDSVLASRKRCWQNHDVRGCTTVASSDDDGVGERIDVCGQPYESMLCGDVATVAERIVDMCPHGGTWTVPDPYQGGTFVVEVYEGGVGGGGDV
ncbi:hypothetical protein BZA05DRAFT_397531 [Tricharina praecox]|uniref:uncharacterized protein n=1 Tax=Tricharina praecox TaxID=43433 RepID=UPI00221EB8AE|nr:uncharacterized protein BZA05DRAFT_397531 [Tricharina praecox]KAI5852313.1 hypothetical protein BZA05DRAFT_397531 [Tricharina praecox]